MTPPLPCPDSDNEALKIIFNCIDNTVLNGDDTHERITQLCDNSLRMIDEKRHVGPVAAVCVYPVFVDTARKVLAGSGIRVASVAGAFPSGQSPLNVKLDEVKYALDQGADEIDMVLSRGTFLEGNRRQAYDEIVAIREISEGRTLKVILETGELQTEANITAAGTLAIEAGADFIKTSTGKIPVGATPEAAEYMLKVIAKNAKISKKMVGFKAAGGISQPDEALQYYRLTQQITGINKITNQTFRIGASRLTGRLFQYLTLQNTEN